MKSEFKNGAEAIKKLMDEVETLESKYVPPPRWLTEKRKTIEAIASFYDFAAHEINKSNRIIKLQQVNYNTVKVLLHKHEMNTTYAQTLRLIGGDEKAAKMIDDQFEFLESELNMLKTSAD